jgi:hypothetical protein
MYWASHGGGIFCRGAWHIVSLHLNFVSINHLHCRLVVDRAELFKASGLPLMESSSGKQMDDMAGELRLPTVPQRPKLAQSAKRVRRQPRNTKRRSVRAEADDEEPSISHIGSVSTVTRSYRRLRVAEPVEADAVVVAQEPVAVPI